MPFGSLQPSAIALSKYKREGYDLSAPPVSVVVNRDPRTGAIRGTSPLPLPDTSGVANTGRIVSVTPENYARSFVDSIKSGGQEAGGGQALFIHPQTKQWVRFSELPVGADGLRQSIGQQDGNPYVNRYGAIDIAHKPQESAWVEFRNSVAPMLGVAAPLAAAALLPAAAVGALGSGTGAAAAATPELASGLFAGGVESAAAGGGGYLSGGGALGLGGAAGAGALPGFAAPMLTGAQVAGTSGGLSGLMSWLGSPTGQAVSQLGSAALQGISAQRAAGQQTAAAQSGIDEQRRQFEAMRAGLAPFQQAGTQALGGFAPFQQAGLQAFQQQQALAGLQGQQAQQQAIGALESSPLYQSLAKQGEEAILQRASATGGLRGGNVQAALAQFRPAMLQNLIDQQYSRLGGLSGTGLSVTSQLSGMGQSAAAMQGQGGMNAASNIGNLLAQQGQAQSGGTLGIGRGIGQALNIPQQMAAQQRAGGLFDALSRIYGAQ